MTVICIECESEMEYKTKYGSKNEGIYKCKECGNFVYEDSMEKWISKKIAIVPNEEEKK